MHITKGEKFSSVLLFIKTDSAGFPKTLKIVAITGF